MIFVTGDLHGETLRFSRAYMPRLTKKDALIVCGDFGFLWDGSDREKRLLKKLGKKKFPILFLDGVHENFPLLNAYPVSDYCGGKAQILSGNVVHLMRGQVYELQGRTLFTFGGGFEAGGTAPGSELSLPNLTEYLQGKSNLEQADYKVDYVFTHEPPASIKRFLASSEDEITDVQVYLDQIAQRVNVKQWFFGSCHMDKRITKTYTAVFQKVVPLEPEDNPKKKEKA